MIGPAVDAVIGELLAVHADPPAPPSPKVCSAWPNATATSGSKRPASGPSRPATPPDRTVKGILAANSDHASVQKHLAGIDTPAWLRGPRAFGAGEATP